MKGPGRDLLLAVSLLALSGYVWYETGSYPAPTGEAGAEGLGPAFYPRLLAILLVGLALLMAGAAVLRRPPSSPLSPAEAIPPGERLRSGALFALLLVYWLVMPLLGYVLSTFVMLAGAMLLLAPPERRRRPGTWALIGGCSAAAVAGIFLLFARVVKVPIPVGRLFGG